MIKRLLMIALGAAGALQAERFFESRRGRFTPNALAGRLIDTINRRLESQRGSGMPGRPGPHH